MQAWDGAFGAIQINGPASAPYDTDLGPLMLSDWTHDPIRSLIDTASKPENDGYPINNGLINGTNVYKDNKHPRFEMHFEAGKAYRLRLVNTALDTHFKIALDNHTMKVIATDFVPIVPFDTDILSIGIGQRYDVIINATQSSGDFWFRAYAASFCGQREDGYDLKAIVRYDSKSKDEPTTTGPTFGDNCDDMPTASLVPALKLDVGPSSSNQTADFQQVIADGVIHWAIKNIPYTSPWDNPSMCCSLIV
jgi:FtsP/CotA-like multicopper oxidase with cupredoxin domain